MKWRSVVSGLLCWARALATPTALSITSSTPELKRAVSDSSNLSIDLSQFPDLVSAYAQFDNKVYCYKGYEEYAANRTDLEEMAYMFCDSKRKPLSFENGVDNGRFVTGNLTYDFHLNWDVFNSTCQGTYEVNPDVCYNIFLEIEQQNECRANRRGGTKAQNCIIYTFGPSL